MRAVEGVAKAVLEVFEVGKVEVVGERPAGDEFHGEAGVGGDGAGDASCRRKGWLGKSAAA